MVLLALVLHCAPLLAATPVPTMETNVAFMGGLGDRSMGSPGADQAADYIFKQFTEAGLTSVGSHQFLHPIAEVSAASLQVDGFSTQLYPWGPNLVYLPITPEEGLTGPLIYVGDGNLGSFQGHALQGAIVLMDSGYRRQLDERRHARRRRRHLPG